MDGEVVGTFVVPEGSAQSRTLDCPNNRTMVAYKKILFVASFRIIISFLLFKASITHTNSDVKMSVEFLWLPPLDYQGGPIVFVLVIYLQFKQ